jgi:hypothetical protein
MDRSYVGYICYILLFYSGYFIFTTPLIVRGGGGGTTFLIQFCHFKYLSMCVSRKIFQDLKHKLQSKPPIFNSSLADFLVHIP